MRIAILTTQTPHHARYVQAMDDAHDVAGVLLETTAVAAPFDTAHRFEQDRDAFERNTWFAGKEPAIGEMAPTRSFPSLNHPDAAKVLADMKADVAVVFGTGKLAGPILDVLPGRLLNLHGGDPQDYRGLDTHLWAVYHGDFPALVSCLHFVEPDLDTGAILEVKSIPLHKGMALHELRHANTETCIAITLSTLKGFARGNMLRVTPQQRRGRYYSFMPSILKNICVEKFTRYTETLP
tara:strand:+ start:26418 stop:27131 length:714 start_codon:yes stop_codon:yes gene_type:complete